MTVDASPGSGAAPDLPDGAATGDDPESPRVRRGRGSVEAGDGGTRRGRRRSGRIVVGIVVVLLVSMWGYVVYLAFGPGRQPPIDRLDDPAFAEAGEARCAEAVAEVDELPGAGATPDADDRADVVDRADAIYARMLDDLDGMTHLVPAGDQRGHAEEWLADWRVYLDDRAEYADALRRDPDARLLVSAKPGESRQVTGWIDEFALANRMPSCATPTDV